MNCVFVYDLYKDPYWRRRDYYLSLIAVGGKIAVRRREIKALCWVPKKTRSLSGHTLSKSLDVVAGL